MILTWYRIICVKYPYPPPPHENAKHASIMFPFSRFYAFLKVTFRNQKNMEPRTIEAYELRYFCWCRTWQCYAVCLQWKECCQLCNFIPISARRHRSVSTRRFITGNIRHLDGLTHFFAEILYNNSQTGGFNSCLLVSGADVRYTKQREKRPED